jgi:signal transduction histidine kinase
MSKYSQDKKNYILAVDDSPDNLFLIQLALEQEGYEVVLANDGPSALDQILKSFPKLIILDVMMPGMSGYDVTKWIRSQSNLPFIPILLITAHEQSSVVKGLDLGADEFIRKPVQIDELQARVRCLLRLKYSIDERENFVYCLTHDLRTPLVAAERMLKLLKEEAFGEVSPQMDRAFNSMLDSNKNLLEMLNTLLDVYKYESGEKFLSFIPINIGELIEDLVTQLKPLAQEKGLELKLNLRTTTEEQTIKGDRLELRRVLTNLIGNAIKFTDKGFIAIRLQNSLNPIPTETDTASNWLTIEIEDTGMGISPEIQASIFDAFRQGNHKRSGTGLGLHLCRQIVEAHGGAIDVKSELNKGSLFAISLPVK